MKPIIGGVAGVIAFVMFLTVVFGSWFTIDQGDMGVLLTNGAISATVGPGLHFKTPWVQSVQTISLRQRAARWDCLPTDKVCVGDHSEVLQAYSRDQQPADMTVSVTYHVPADEVSNVYAAYGNIETLAARTIWRKTPQEVKTVFGQYDAVSVIQDRARFNQEVAAAVSRAIDGPVVIDSVQVENINFSADYVKAVEARMTAQVAVQRQEQQLAQEKILADIALTQATGRANSVKAEADANAYKTTIEGNATAAAIKARSAALSGNPLLVELTKAERWNGTLPSTVLPTGALPFLDAHP